MAHMDRVPGPVDASVLYMQSEHRSSQPTSSIRFVEHNEMLNEILAQKSPVIQRLLELAGFSCVIDMRRVQMDPSLLTSLLERWRPETHTFHFRLGEATVTLQDMSLISGLNVDGLPVTGPDVPSEGWEALCLRLLGAIPTRIKSGKVKLSWIRETFFTDDDLFLDIEDEQEATQKVRALIFYHIGCSVLADSSGDMVPLRYLLYLRDLTDCGQLAWGAAALAHMYAELDRGSKIGTSRIYGFFTVLQVWAWEHVHIGRPIVRHRASIQGGSLALKWIGVRSFRENVQTATLAYYRNELDTQHPHQIIWAPYDDEEIAQLHQLCRSGQNVWMSRVPLICYDIVAMHLPDRVMRQFGMRQHIPMSVERIHVISRRNKTRSADILDWSILHRQYVERWEEREESLVVERGDANNDVYMQWYWSITRRWIQTQIPPPTIAYQPHGPIERRLVDTILEGRNSLDEIRRSTDLSSTTKAKVENTLTYFDETINMFTLMYPFQHYGEQYMPQQEPSTIGASGTSYAEYGGHGTSCARFGGEGSAQHNEQPAFVSSGYGEQVMTYAGYGGESSTHHQQPASVSSGYGGQGMTYAGYGGESSAHQPTFVSSGYAMDSQSQFVGSLFAGPSSQYDSGPSQISQPSQDTSEALQATIMAMVRQAEATEFERRFLGIPTAIPQQQPDPPRQSTSVRSTRDQVTRPVEPPRTSTSHPPGHVPTLSERNTKQKKKKTTHEESHKSKGDAGKRNDKGGGGGGVKGFLKIWK